MNEWILIILIAYSRGTWFASWWLTGFMYDLMPTELQLGFWYRVGGEFHLLEAADLKGEWDTRSNSSDSISPSVWRATMLHAQVIYHNDVSLVEHDLLRACCMSMSEFSQFIWTELGAIPPTTNAALLIGTDVQ